MADTNLARIAPGMRVAARLGGRGEARVCFKKNRHG